MTRRDYFTIGEVVQKLSGRYPDLSVSKLRYFEDENLIAPERTSGGYRKFFPRDLERLETILILQKDYFLPLNVIREKLEALEPDASPSELIDRQRSETAAAELPLETQEQGRTSTADLRARYGITEVYLNELVKFGIITLEVAAPHRFVSAADLPVVRAAWNLRTYGIEPRHLRMYRTFAQREAQLFSQLLMPTFRHKTPESRALLAETLGEISTHLDVLKGRLSREMLVEEMRDLL